VKARNKMAANKNDPPKFDCDLDCLLIKISIQLSHGWHKD
jgi:hypothetical protein